MYFVSRKLGKYFSFIPLSILVCIMRRLPRSLVNIAIFYILPGW